MIGVLDYGIGNVGAFLRIFHSQNIKAIPIQEPSDFSKIKKIVLPGVGSFDTAMTKLNNSGLRDSLDEFVLTNKLPLLGVCIGMHMLGSSSEEGHAKGLSYIQGKTIHMSKESKSNKILLPHMGWNNILIKEEESIWENINPKLGFYFLHSYKFKSLDDKNIIGRSQYHGEIACAVKSNNIFGFQFHPEKSLNNGITLLTNFAIKI